MGKGHNSTLDYLISKAIILAIGTYKEVLTTSFTKHLRNIEDILSSLRGYPKSLAPSTDISMFSRLFEVTLKTNWKRFEKIFKTYSKNCERNLKVLNVDISHLGTKMTSFKILEIFRNWCKNLGRRCDGHL